MNGPEALFWNAVRAETPTEPEITLDGWHAFITGQSDYLCLEVR